ncbi:hypothetical protein P7K49_024684 [Saguinus oedipus]|uniref:Uncharacterized protein n=1 Tax=Saguinus oedipus TaxID=9490 RepID=A0ABQ9URV2_SAGOE|nr:hypothetical protein P7K49_024684 [Saguinus oedipus]
MAFASFWVTPQRPGNAARDRVVGWLVLGAGDVPQSSARALAWPCPRTLACLGGSSPIAVKQPLSATPQILQPGCPGCLLSSGLARPRVLRALRPRSQVESFGNVVNVTGKLPAKVQGLAGCLCRSGWRKVPLSGASCVSSLMRRLHKLQMQKHVLERCSRASFLGKAGAGTEAGRTWSLAQPVSRQELGPELPPCSTELPSFPQLRAGAWGSLGFCPSQNEGTSKPFSAGVLPSE